MTVFRTSAARWLVLWAALFGLYAATLNVDAFLSSDYGGDEPHYLLTAESIVSDGDFDLTDEYAAKAYSRFYPFALDVHGRPTGGRIHEPHGVGFALAITPAYAIAGPKGVQIFLAAIAALGFVLAAALARRVVSEPWATAGTLLIAISPPAIAYGATIYPELMAGTILCGAALLALRVRERLRALDALAAAALIAVLPWLGPKYLVAAIPILIGLVRWAMRRRRGLVALFCGEIVAASLLVFIPVNRVLFGGLTPYAADVKPATDAEFPVGYLERIPRLVALWLDREYGLIRWAPVLALCFLGGWLLWRSRRDGMRRLVPERIDVEAAAALCLGVCAAQVAVAAFAAPTMFGFWFPGRHLVAALPFAVPLAAWGLRHSPRSGAALGALTVLSSGWLLVAFATGHADGWVTPTVSAPWGPLEAGFPLYGADSAWAAVVAGAVVAGLVFLAVREWRNWRKTVGTTRRAYSP